MAEDISMFPASFLFRGTQRVLAQDKKDKVHFFS